MNKQEIRQKSRRLLSETNQDFNEKCEESILQKLLSFELCGKNILIYNSKPNELSTKKIISTLSEIANVYLPRTKEEVEIVRYTKDTKFISGKFGIEEPAGIAEDKRALDIAILPCLAADEKGNRIGNGYGYFDKFLTETNFLKIAICFDFQIEKEIPAEEFDIKMDIIVTEKRCFSVK